MADRPGACQIGKATTGGGWQRIGSDVGHASLCNRVNGSVNRETRGGTRTTRKGIKLCGLNTTIHGSGQALS